MKYKEYINNGRGGERGTRRKIRQVKRTRRKRERGGGGWREESKRQGTGGRED